MGGLLPEPIQGTPDSPSTGAAVSALVIASTANTAVLTYTPIVTQGCNINCGFEVTGGPTTVSVYIQWTGKDGSTKTLWLTANSGWTLGPDDYSFLPVTVTALANTAVTIYVQANTANQVSFSGTIWQDV